MNYSSQSALAFHSFEDVFILQTIDNIIIGGKDIPKGYVNATHMCRANDKSWSNYWKSAKAKSFAGKVSAGLPFGRAAVISIEGGNEKDNQGTWVHPDIAYHLAVWISDDFAIWAMRVLRNVAEGNYQALTPEALEAEEKIRSLWNQLRQTGVLTRNDFTFQIKEYMLRHLELSDKERTWMYAEVSDQINFYVFGQTAKELCEQRQCHPSHLRDSHSEQDLKTIELIENCAAKQILKDKHPQDAVKLAIDFLF